MTYRVVPLDASTTEARVWIGTLVERPDSARLVVRTANADVPPDAAWQTWASGDGSRALSYQRLLLTGLQPRTTYPLELLRDGARVATARLTTLPDRLPGLDEQPFTVLLGSCYGSLADAGGTLATTFALLPQGARPEVKVLCGDQVYLDSPWTHFLWHLHDRDQLEADFFDNYVRTWSLGVTPSGFQDFLSSAATYFISDDHEYWNSAPNLAPNIADTWTQARRDTWLAAARGLFGAFQATGSLARFAVGPLSFLIADTRVNREPGSGRFLSDQDLDQVRGWIGGLSGPGVLVIGQPIFAEPVGFFGRLSDITLPNYAQYADLARLIAGSSHSVLLLTGDVHYGRVARCRLASGADLVEVISSPLALVDSMSASTWQAAPTIWPATPIAGLAQAPVHTEALTLVDNHFATLGFSAVGPRVKLSVQYWKTAAGVAPVPLTGGEVFLT